MKNKTFLISMGFLGAAMLAISLYLTLHYFETRFPQGLSGGSLCNINDFFNCDKTITSPASAPFNVPISVLGAVIGVLVLFGALVRNLRYEKTLYFTAIVNLGGCLALFGYSLLGLRSLCPFCTLYYICSGLLVLLFYVQKKSWRPDFPILLSFAVVLLTVAFYQRTVVNGKIAAIEKSESTLRESVLTELAEKPQMGEPDYASKFKIIAAEKAQVRMVIFSDFECPACRMLSERLPEIIAKYKGRVDISYYFYPLDQACNPNMNRPLHQHACQAALAAICATPKRDFLSLHDMLFENQEKISQGFVSQFIKNEGLEACVESKETKAELGRIIAAAAKFEVQSTPTFLLNGIKFQGVLPMYQLSIIFDDLIKKAAQ